MKKLIAALMICTAALASSFAADAVKNPAEIARIAFESMQQGNIAAVLPYASGSAKTSLEAIMNMMTAVEGKDLDGVLKYSLIAAGQKADARTVKQLATAIKMQKKENATFAEARKKIDQSFAKYKNATLGEIKENITGDTATVTTAYTMKNGDAKTESTHFKKIGEKWFFTSPANAPKHKNK
jgi:hypothetical protein